MAAGIDTVGVKPFIDGGIMGYCSYRVLHVKPFVSGFPEEQTISSPCEAGAWGFASRGFTGKLLPCGIVVAPV